METDMDIFQTLSSILSSACGPSRPKPTTTNLPLASVNGQRAVNKMEDFWIKTLHQAFAKYYSKSTGTTVLSKAVRDTDWERNEFLHDITVVERQKVRSPYRETELLAARRFIWQVESELNSNGRQVAIDFSKLSGGSAENKMMVLRLPVTRQTDGVERVCKFVESMASGWDRRLFLLFLPPYAISHPHLNCWTADRSLPIRLFQRPCHDGLLVECPRPSWMDSSL